MSSAEELVQQIEEQTKVFSEMKSGGGGDKALIKEQALLLAGLREKLRIANGGDPNEKKGESAKPISLKTPKGTKDYGSKEMSVRSDIFNTIIKVFEKHGAVTIDTPVFELKEILTGKYGEDSKLIYDLKDQGGEECSLRYDLTVPFARHVAMNKISNIKRYQIAKVYRRDQPAMTKGRMREFYQCDYDIAGAYDPMIPDAECVKVAVDVLTRLDVGAFVVKINHRKILDAIFEVSGVPEAKVRSISSAVDKLDKLPWSDVKKEMVDDKGLSEEVADKIGEYVLLKGGEELLAKLQSMPELMASKKAQEGVADMALFFKYARVFKVLDHVSFDMSLARGLDYYTGIIYEAVLVEENVRPTEAQPTATKANEVKDGNQEIDESQVRVGSIAGGGRYDGLVGRFNTSKRAKDKDSGKGNVPCVGISFGVERIFSIILSRRQTAAIKANRTMVYVISIGDSLLEERMAIASELWDNDIATEFMYKVKPNFKRQMDNCDNEFIPWGVLIGADEVQQGVVKIKNMLVKTEGESKDGVTVKRADMVAELKKRLQMH